MRETILEVVEFTRVEICVFAVFIAVAGYMSSNPLDAGILPVCAAAFLSCAVGYSYNNITDRLEDRLNSRKVTGISSSPLGQRIVMGYFLVGLTASYIISLHSMFFYIFITLIGLTYSLLRVKQITILKNLFTASVVGGIYVFGAISGGNPISARIAQEYMFIAGLILTGTFIADLRDIEGDLKAGLKTVPLLYGHGLTKKLTYLLTVSLTAYLIIGGLHHYRILIIPLLLSAFFVGREEYRISHVLNGYTFMANVLINIARNSLVMP